MKRIKIITSDATLLAKPLGLAQLEEYESTINEIVTDSAKIGESGSTMFPVSLLKKQAVIVLLALQNHDPAVTMAAVESLSVIEIAQAFGAVLSGSGLEEVAEGEAKAGQ